MPSTGSPAPMKPQKHPYPLKERGLHPVAHRIIPAKCKAPRFPRSQSSNSKAL